MINSKQNYLLEILKNHLTVQKIALAYLKKVMYKMFRNHIYLIYMFKQDLALNILQNPNK